MCRAAIRQTLFRRNVLRENSSEFNDVKLSQYTVSPRVIYYELFVIAKVSLC